MNIKNHKIYSAIALTTAKKMFNLHSNTYLSNSISRKDLEIIALTTAYDAINKYNVMKVKKIPLKSYIKSSVTGTLYNIINRKCLQHNNMITFLPMEKITNISDLSGNCVMPKICKNVTICNLHKKKNISSFYIKDLQSVLNRKEYSFVIDYFIKQKTLTEIYKKYNISWFLIAKFKDKIVKIIKKFINKSNYDLTNYEN